MVRVAVEADPENKAYRDSLGWALYRIGRYDEAIRELELAASDKDPDGIILEHLGHALADGGRHVDAKRRWKQAVEQFRRQGDKDAVQRVQGKLNSTKP